MIVIVKIPSVFKQFTNNSSQVSAQGDNIKAVLKYLEDKFPQLKNKIIDHSGKIHKFVNLYVNGENIRYLQNEATQLKETDEILIIPATAGG